MATEKLKRPVKQKRVYDNCKMLNPSGEFMAYVPLKRMNWYLDRDLATKIDEKTFQLTFEPNGSGHAKDVEYQQSIRENKCVVCGTIEHLTMHHIVPYCYRRFFPDEYKSRNSFDIVCVCHECHDAYEAKAEELKKTLIKQFKVQKPEYLTEAEKEAKKLGRICGLMNALELHADKMPQERVQEIERVLTTHFGEEVTKDNIGNFSDECERLKQLRASYPDESSRKVLEAFLAEDQELFDFILYWRKHFLKKAKPRHLSSLWLESYQKREW